eukprot:scaffold9992_cov64-Phaeocystis_antarctica.AAC.4
MHSLQAPLQHTPFGVYRRARVRRVVHVDQAPPPLWSRHSPSNGPCMTRSWTNIGLLACRRVVCDTCVLKTPSPAAVGAAGTGCTAQ